MTRDDDERDTAPGLRRRLVRGVIEPPPGEPRQLALPPKRAPTAPVARKRRTRLSAGLRPSVQGATVVFVRWLAIAAVTLLAALERTPESIGAAIAAVVALALGRER